MKTLPLIPSLVLPAVMVLASALLPAPPAHAAHEIKQVEIEAKFVEVSQNNLRELGYDFIGKFNTSISQRVLVPGGVSPQALGTIVVPPPPHLPATGDIQVKISPEVFRPAVGGNHILQTPLVTAATGRQAVTAVLRDLGVNLNAQPVLSRDRSRIDMSLVPAEPEFSHFSVDGFGTVAFGNVDRTVTTTHDVIVKDTHTVDRPITVRVPFDNGQQIVDREEIRFVPVQETTKHTEQVSQTRSVNRLGDAAGGGGLRVNYLFNRHVGVNLRGEVLDGAGDPLGLVTASIFGEYPCCWPVTPTYSIGGGVLFPRAQAVMDVGLGLKRQISPCFSVFTEAHYITNFGCTNFGEFNVGARFALGRKTAATAETGGGTAAPEPKRGDRAPYLGRIPVLAHVFREHGKPAETGDLLIFVTPRIIKSDE